MQSEADPHFNEVQDTPAEVDATFRTLRRIAITYFVVFLVVLAAFPVLTITLDWWTESRLIGNLSPAFLFAGVGLYVVFAVMGIAAATLSSSVESRMLGHQRQGEATASESWADTSQQKPDGS
ncbi:hypothetical protein [Garicola koreensis]|uniref:DUF485 domain-containing protein n=1 Tax=Garicola koreensis TaxID=1262554 RepID=A0A7W5TX50_9MICC|nr:hypothetical protein [Garicola koreensis]MBB3668314.1 hypothetical protein [Garicola koreensis]